MAFASGLWYNFYYKKNFQNYAENKDKQIDQKKGIRNS